MTLFSQFLILLLMCFGFGKNKKDLFRQHDLQSLTDLPCPAVVAVIGQSLFGVGVLWTVNYGKERRQVCHTEATGTKWICFDSLRHQISKLAGQQQGKKSNKQTHEETIWYLSGLLERSQCKLKQTKKKNYFGFQKQPICPWTARYPGGQFNAICVGLLTHWVSCRGVHTFLSFYCLPLFWKFSECTSLTETAARHFSSEKFSVWLRSHREDSLTLSTPENRWLIASILALIK